VRIVDVAVFLAGVLYSNNVFLPPEPACRKGQVGCLYFYSLNLSTGAGFNVARK